LEALDMTIRNSLVMVTGDHAAAAVEAAFTLAEQSRGHVTGLHVTGDTVMNMPSIIEGMTERQIVTEFERMRSRLDTSGNDGARDVHGGLRATWRRARGGAGSH
jgi:hypothetical protein